MITKYRLPNIKKELSSLIYNLAYQSYCDGYRKGFTKDMVVSELQEMSIQASDYAYEMQQKVLGVLID